MGGVATHAHTWTGSMGKRSFCVVVVVDPECQVSQSNATADLGHIILIETNGLEIFEINDHAATLAARGE